MKILIDPDFASLMPPHTDEEAASLAKSLAQEGCRDPLVVWDETGALVDGHQRKGICERLGIPFGVKRLKFADRGAAMIWIINNQFARRNLTPFQRAELALKLEPMLRAASERPGHRNPPGTEDARRAAIAKAAGLSDSTVMKAKTLLANAPAKVIQKLREGRARITPEYMHMTGLGGSNTGYRLVEKGKEVIELRNALEAIRSYEPPIGEAPRETVDKLQDMAARALACQAHKRSTAELKQAILARRQGLSELETTNA